MSAPVVIDEKEDIQHMKLESLIHDAAAALAMHSSHIPLISDILRPFFCEAAESIATIPLTSHP